MSQRVVGGVVELPERFELGQGVSLKAKVDAFKRALVLAALDKAGTLAGAARLLGLNRPTLQEIMKRYGIAGTEARAHDRVSSQAREKERHEQHGKEIRR